MQEIKSLLDKVLQGDEAAFHQFCMDRQEQNVSWQLIHTLKYFHEQASNMPEKLDKCYPEALIEMAYFLRDIYVELKHDPSVVFFMNYIKQAAKNNDGAKAALIILLSKHKSILTSVELTELIEQAKSIEHVINPNKHQLFLLGYLNQAHLWPIPDNVDSDTKAVEYLEKAAALSHISAMNVLGMMNHLGRANKQLTNEARSAFAIKWYKEAAQLGNALATLNIAGMYLPCVMYKFKKFTEEQKCELYKGLVITGHADKIQELINLDVMREGSSTGNDLTDEEKIKDGIIWLQKAAKLGVKSAMIQLALIYQGIVMEKAFSDEAGNKEAFEWLEKVSALGDTNAKISIAYMYVEGEIGKNLNEKARLLKAKDYFEQALITATFVMWPFILTNIKDITEKLAQLERLNSSLTTKILPTTPANLPARPITELQLQQSPMVLFNQLIEVKEKIEEEAISCLNDQTPANDNLVRIKTQPITQLQKKYLGILREVLSVPNPQTFFKQVESSAVVKSPASLRRSIDNQREETTEDDPVAIKRGRK